MDKIEAFGGWLTKRGSCLGEDEEEEDGAGVVDLNKEEPFDAQRAEGPKKKTVEEGRARKEEVGARVKKNRFHRFGF